MVLLVVSCPLRSTAQASEPFTIGINYPWIAHGHDFGQNAWGYDGLCVSGWTCQKYYNSQGFTGAQISSTIKHAGAFSLKITADLKGGDTNKSNGEVYLNLLNHAPAGTVTPLNLANVTASCWLYLPQGSAGLSQAPNGIQLFFKSTNHNSLYSPWVNIRPQWEGQWIQISANASGPASHKDALYNPAQIAEIGVKIAINSSSAATLKGDLYLDDFIINTAPALAFDFERLEIDRDFRDLRQNTFGLAVPAVARVFIFADGRASPEFAADGSATGLDEKFFSDFDKMLEVARLQNIKIIPVLLDFPWCDSPEVDNGVTKGGHSDIIRNPAKTQSFLDNALIPLVRRYRNHPQIHAWEIMNEPEWAVQEIPKYFQIGDPVTIAQMREFVRRCAQAVNVLTSAPVMVGSARRKWLSYWQGLGLDLYQFHWYDHFAADEPFPWAPCSALGLDKPCLVGEVPTIGTDHSMSEYLQAGQAGGYCGVLAWSYRAGDDFSDFATAQPALAAWCRDATRTTATEMVVFDPANGDWWNRSCSSPMTPIEWGGAGFTPLRGDFDGDSKPDYAAFHKDTGRWYIKSSTGAVLAWGKPWGNAAMTPLAGDFDGDGRDDMAVYLPTSGRWYIRSIGGTVLAWGTPWGSAGMIPVPGDYDGDGRNDLGVYASSTGRWYIRSLAGAVIAWGVSWGGSGMSPVGGDYDGDGRTDLAVYASAAGRWYIRSLSGKVIAWGRSWGAKGMVPVCGDYDGDGRSDLALYTSATGQWYIRSLNGTYLAWDLGWGGQGMVPVGVH